MLTVQRNSGKSVGLTFGKMVGMPAALIKLQKKGQMVIPRSLREAAGVAEGTLIKISLVEGRQFLLTPQFTLDRTIVEGPAKSRKQLLQELARTVDEIRQESQEKGLDKMSKREIEAAVAWGRGDRKKAGKTRTK
jgi:bifunctional DNA-binding transcriptional regulator/antitoxin component of YhaV-PrlF toxin-antitoxin module